MPGATLTTSYCLLPIADCRLPTHDCRTKTGPGLLTVPLMIMTRKKSGERSAICAAFMRPGLSGHVSPAFWTGLGVCLRRKPRSAPCLFHLLTTATRRTRPWHSLPSVYGQHRPLLLEGGQQRRGPGSTVSADQPSHAFHGISPRSQTI